MIANYRNEFQDKKCLEIQSYLGSKKSLECWKFIKKIRSSNSGKSQLNLISADTWGKYCYKLLVEDRKEILGKTENELEKGTGNVIEIDSNAVNRQ